MKESRHNDTKNKLSPFRARIDALDDKIMELLGERFGIVREVARIKIKNDIRIVQSDRVREVKERNAKAAKKHGLSPTLIRTLYALIIDEAHTVEHGLKLAQEKISKKIVKKASKKTGKKK
jgi:chorismate mutase-like protein